MASSFVYTTAIKKLRKLKKRIKVVPGGTSAGKTFGILPILIDKAARTPLLEISVVSESIPHLRKGAMKDFLKIMKATGRYIDTNWNRSLLTYTFSNGSYIEFFSANQEDKTRGPRRNILYINEANNIDFETYHSLAIRTDLEIWIDFNPTHEFWVHKELSNDPDVDEVILTYMDNEGLSESIVKEIEKAKLKAYHNPSGDIYDEGNVKDSYWDNWWKVYGLGLVGALQGVVYTNWKIVKEIPKDASFVAHGLDFGFSNSPAAIISVWEYNSEVYINEELYETGLINDDLHAKALGIIDIRGLTVADAAEPKSIEDLRRRGWNIVKSISGQDSVRAGIDATQARKINVTESSTNVIKEFRNYVWATDKSGNSLNEPVKAYDHTMDCLKNVVLKCLTRPSGKYHII